MFEQAPGLALCSCCQGSSSSLCGRYHGYAKPLSRIKNGILIPLEIKNQKRCHLFEFWNEGLVSGFHLDV